MRGPTYFRVSHSDTGEHRRFSLIPGKPTFLLLRHKIRRVFGLAPAYRFQVTYQDEHKERIVLQDTASLHQCVRRWARTRTYATVVKLTVSHVAQVRYTTTTPFLPRAQEEKKKHQATRWIEWQLTNIGQAEWPAGCAFKHRNNSGNVVPSETKRCFRTIALPRLGVGQTVNVRFLVTCATLEEGTHCGRWAVFGPDGSTPLASSLHPFVCVHLVKHKSAQVI